MNKKFIIILLLVCVALTSCTPTPPKNDTPQFKVDTPYILENAKLDENMSTIAIPAQKQRLGIENSQFEFLRDTAKCSAFRVKKVASKSYYYETDDRPIYFTISDIEILEVISKKSDVHENIDAGTVVKIFECFSFDPNGNFLAGISNDTIFDNELYTKFPYERLNDESIYNSFSLNNKYPLTDGLRGYYAISLPYLKFDTEYIMMLQLGKFGSPAGAEGVSVAFCGDKLKIPNKFIEGVIVNPTLYELSESAYNMSKEHFFNYSTSNELRELKLYGMEDNYYRDVWILWELYGNNENIAQ